MRIFLFITCLFVTSCTFAQSESGLLPPGMSEEMAARTVVDPRVRRFIVPKKVVWAEGCDAEKAANFLLEIPLGQTSTSDMQGGFLMKKNPNETCAILLDFGTEIQGGIRLEARDTTAAPESKIGRAVRVRIRFGESADEAMAEIDEKGAQNDHSARDQTVNVPWLGATEVGESAFRFVRIDLPDDGAAIWFDSIRAVFSYRDLPWQGSFRCSDARLNQIWQTAAHTQHLTLQTYMFEGAKRDRLVWYGDSHPQTMSTLYIFGTPDVLRDSLGKYALQTWPLPKWMNGMPNYSLWHLICVSDLYRFSGDAAYLEQFRTHFMKLLEQLKPCISAETGEAGFGSPFLDWPTADNAAAKRAGTHAMFVMAFERLEEIFTILGDPTRAGEAHALAEKMRRFTPDHGGNKQAAALMSLAGLERADAPNGAALALGGPRGFSTFYGFYMLEALAKEGKSQDALDILRQYWGGMIDRGATTFWEDFDLDWLADSGRIDELTPEGKKSLHGDYGKYCYIGFRHSLCHGWASGPAPWLSAHVLGVTPASPGFRTVRIQPFLGDLDWAEGSVPTPYGMIFVRHEKTTDGQIRSTVKLPEGVQQVD